MSNAANPVPTAKISMGETEARQIDRLGVDYF